MSLIAVQGGATGTGTVTVLAPITNTDRTLTLPDVTDTVAGIAATQTLTNKTLTSPTLTTPNINSAQFATVSGTAPIYPCRAWVDFDGTGTPSIRGSGNVSSITDITTGGYTINFTTAMPDVNFAVSGSAGSKDNDGTDNGVVCLFNRATSSVSIYTRNVQSIGGATDYDAVNVAIFR